MRIELSCLALFLVLEVASTRLAFSGERGLSASRSLSLDPSLRESDARNDSSSKTKNKAKKIIAKCKLEPKNNSAANGEIRFYFENNELIAEVKLKDVIAGMHGFHIHEKGDCSAADASSAGGHYNPYHGKHGGTDTSVRHFGDLGNIEVLANGTSFKKIVLKDPNFNPKKDWKNLLNKSVVLHANADDLSTDPAGNSGPRVACGVIQ